MVSSVPERGLLGDWNGDGRFDLAFTNSGNVLSVLFGNGDGTFGSARRYPVGPSVPLILSDLNGDGHRDMVYGLYDSGQLNLRLAQGDGSFTEAETYTLLPYVRKVLVGDIDGDRDADLVTVHATEQRSVLVRLGALVGDGQGQYTSLDEPATTSTDGGIFDAAIGDLNGDGRADLITSRLIPNATKLSVALGSGDGRFTPSHEYAPRDALKSILSDLNADSKLDLVGISRASVETWLGTGDGALTLANRHAIAPGPALLDAGDMNGDGRLDLAIFYQLLPAVTLLLGRGDGTFSDSGYYQVPILPTDFAFGDVNNDDLVDLVVSGDGGFAALLGDGAGGFVCTQRYPVASLALALDDLDGDGRLDVVTGARDGIRYSIRHDWQLRARRSASG